MERDGQLTTLKSLIKALLIVAGLIVGTVVGLVLWTYAQYGVHYLRAHGQLTTLMWFVGLLFLWVFLRLTTHFAWFVYKSHKEYEADLKWWDRREIQQKEEFQRDKEDWERWDRINKQFEENELQRSKEGRGLWLP